MYLFIQYLQINEYSTAKPRNVKNIYHYAKWYCTVLEGS